MTNQRTIQLALIALITGCFIAGSHLIYNNIIHTWNTGQLRELAARTVLRSELATDKAVNTLVQIQTRGQTTCSSKTIAAFKDYVMSVGSIKDIRLRSDHTSCAVFSANGLQADLDHLSHWETGLNTTIKLAVLKHGKQDALSVLWKSDNHAIVAVLSTGGLLYDMVPTALRPHLTIQIALNGGKKITAYDPQSMGYNVPENLADQTSFTAHSKRYPIKAHMTISKADLAAWNNNHSMVFDMIACLFGLVTGFLASRALFPPKGPINEIDKAIQMGEFVPFFQPIINLGSSEITGFEMLARWIKPDGEMVSPGRFIPLAENYGRIDAMLFSLLRHAGQEIGSELRRNPRLKMTFNVTPEQFLDPTFLPRLLNVVKLVNLPLRSLVAEITERQEIADLDLAAQTVTEYKKHGIRIAIDDAGTGHNGLSSIQKLDVCTLKLDKIFIDGIVDNTRSRQMVEMLANLARQYKMGVVAEGIETPEQAIEALNMGIEEGQGFYYSRPIPADDLLALLNEQRQPLTQNNIPQQQAKKTRKIRYAS